MIRRSRAQMLVLILLPAAFALPRPLRAQNPHDSVQAKVDSLADRLDQAEQAIETLRRQLQEQHQASVGSRLRNHVEISGLVLFNGWYNNARTNNADVPQFVANPQDSTGLPNANLAAAVRQTRLGFT